jgi:cell division protein FtsB
MTPGTEAEMSRLKSENNDLRRENADLKKKVRDCCGCAE